jgi:hypothetical protein
MGLGCIRGRERNTPRPSWPIAYDDRHLKHEIGGLRAGTRVPRNSAGDATSIIKPLTTNRKWLFMEAAGIAPASREALVTASTCVAVHLSVSLEAPIGKVPFGLSRHFFNSSRNRQLGSSDPRLSSPAASPGQKRVARPLLFFRQRDGDQRWCWQLKFWSAFCEAR